MGEKAYVAPTAAIIGDVELGEKSNCWFGAVLRGDVGRIEVGENTNIQDNAVLHCDQGVPVIIGKNVTVGHCAILHSCEIGDHVLIGMGATILSRVKIGEGAVVAAGSVVKEGMVIPPYTLVAGTPAEIKKELPKTIKAKVIENAEKYVQLAEEYKQNMKIGE